MKQTQDDASFAFLGPADHHQQPWKAGAGILALLAVGLAVELAVSFLYLAFGTELVGLAGLGHVPL